MKKKRNNEASGGIPFIKYFLTKTKLIYLRLINKTKKLKREELNCENCRRMRNKKKIPQNDRFCDESVIICCIGIGLRNGDL